jgi:hypothetical protein
MNLIVTILAPIAAALHLWRRPEPRTRARTLEIYLLWWFALAFGATGVISACVHVFDGAATAEQIGFTRGDGGFQFENAMGDLAIGVCSLLCLRIRGTFWIAVLVFASIQFYGDGVGHVYQWLHNDNTEPGNVGIPLVYDFVAPTVATALYLALRAARAGELAPLPTPVPAAAQSRRG